MRSNRIVIARRPKADAAIQSRRALYVPLDRHALASLGLAMMALDQPQVILL
jgi:hypothetical protein